MKVEGTLLDVRSATDFNKNETRNQQVHNLASAPATPVLGQIYFDTALVDVFVCTNATGPVWERLLSGTVQAGQYAAGSIVNADISGTAAIAFAKLASPVGSFSFNSQLLTNVLDPVSAQDAATKAYVDSVATGLDFHLSARVATTAAETFTIAGGAATVISGLSGGAAPQIDGITVAVNDRVLIKDAPAATGAGSLGSNQPANGIYRITALGTGQVNVSRATDMDASAEVSPGAFLFVESGTANADTGFVLATDGAITLNTTALQWSTYSRAESLSAGAGLTRTGLVLDVGAGTGITVAADSVGLTIPVVVSSGGTGQITLTSNAVLIGNGTTAILQAAGTANQVLRVPGGGGTPAFGAIDISTAAAVTNSLAIANGGTAGTTAATARQNLGATGFYSSATHGAGTTISISQATHGLAASQVIQVQVIEVSSGDVVYPDMNVSSGGAVTITFATSVGANSHRVTLVGQS